MEFVFNAPRMIGCSLLQLRSAITPVEKNSQDNKLAFVTGGNNGIGYEITRALSLQGCEVVILCRNEEKAKAACEKLNQECTGHLSNGSVSYLLLDLADLISVKTCIEEIRTKYQDRTIDYFVCNGGIMNHPYATSPQGYELHYATNHLGHFALIGGIMDFLNKSASKVIVMTGDIAVLADDASHDYQYEDTGLMAYCRSKVCNQSFGRELHKRYPELGVYVVHPGVVDSNLVPPSTEAGWYSTLESFVRPLVTITSEQGAQCPLVCLLTNYIPKGSYYHNGFGCTDYHPMAANDEWSKKLWKTSARLVAESNVPQYY